MPIPTPRGDLTLGHILEAGGIALDEVIVLRHTYTVGGIETSADLTPEKILNYTRRQSINNKLGKNPPLCWLVFMADGARRSRLLVAYANHGEVLGERTADHRHFISVPATSCPRSPAGSSSNGQATQ